MFGVISRRFSSRAGRPVYVIGVGMTKFTKPGTSGLDYPAMVKIAGDAALLDAGVPLSEVEQVRVLVARVATVLNMMY